MSMREIYELPEHPPATYRILYLTFVLPALALGEWLEWLLFPACALAIVVLAVIVSLAVAIGLWHVLRDRGFEEPPQCDPVPPPGLRSPE
jgi:hypothetical protein